MRCFFFIGHPTKCLQINRKNHALIQKWVEVLFNIMRDEAKGRKSNISRNHKVCAGHLHCFVEEENTSGNTDF